MAILPHKCIAYLKKKCEEISPKSLTNASIKLLDIHTIIQVLKGSYEN